MLLEHVTQVLDRLRGSDIRTLNRRLKRAFDITELSSMSNSIIDNIIMELDTLESRFLWVQTHEKTDETFFPFLRMLKDILTELGVLKSTMNELQVAYVKKVEESEVRVEEEIIRKRELKKKQKSTTIDTPTSPLVIGTRSLAWITSMFTAKSELVQSPEDDEYQFFRSSGDRQKRQPIVSKSTSTSTSRSIPIAKKTVHRINIDYEGIRPIQDGTNFSSSWLGGK